MGEYELLISSAPLRKEKNGWSEEEERGKLQDADDECDQGSVLLMIRICSYGYESDNVWKIPALMSTNPWQLCI
jgi:hypothetical protein